MSDLVLPLPLERGGRDDEHALCLAEMVEQAQAATAWMVLPSPISSASSARSPKRGGDGPRADRDRAGECDVLGVAAFNDAVFIVTAQGETLGDAAARFEKWSDVLGDADLAAAAKFGDDLGRGMLGRARGRSQSRMRLERGRRAGRGCARPRGVSPAGTRSTRGEPVVSAARNSPLMRRFNRMRVASTCLQVPRPCGESPGRCRRTRGSRDRGFPPDKSYRWGKTAEGRDDRVLRDEIGDRVFLVDRALDAAENLVLIGGAPIRW